MRALTIRQPWAWAILFAGKDIENRDWPIHFRGPIAVHAAKGMTQEEYREGVRFITQAFMKNALRQPLIDYRADSRRMTIASGDLVIPDFDSMIRGAFVGMVHIVDCVTQSDSPWFQGDYGFVLADPQPFKTPIEYRGSLGLWSVPAPIAREMRI